MVAVGHEMQTADAVHLDRRDRLAAATRQRLIDAYVTEVLTAVPPRPMNGQ